MNILVLDIILFTYLAREHNIHTATPVMCHSKRKTTLPVYYSIYY